MPFLPLEAFISPDNLFEQVAASDDTDHRWWVLRTRPRAEKSLARQLSGQNLHFFLPQYQKRSRSNGRSFECYHPLFTGYMFLHGDASDRLHALETNQVAQVIQVEDQNQLHRDLQHVHELMKSNTALLPEERLRSGTMVEIVGGPFTGMKGKILTCRNKLRFLVEVRFLRQGVSVDVESWMIHPLGQPIAHTVEV